MLKTGRGQASDTKRAPSSTEYILPVESSLAESSSTTVLSSTAESFCLSWSRVISPAFTVSKEKPGKSLCAFWNCEERYFPATVSSEMAKNFEALGRRAAFALITSAEKSDKTEPLAQPSRWVWSAKSASKTPQKTTGTSGKRLACFSCRNCRAASSVQMTTSYE